MDKSLPLIWVDGAGGAPFLMGDGRLPLDCPGGAAPRTKGFVLLKNGGWSSAPSVG